LRAISSELARGFIFDRSRPPYPGIHAFEAEDAAIYFGRDEEVRLVIERLDARRTQGSSRLLVIVGASGAGKSSMLKSGVLPQLARRRRDWIVLPTLRSGKEPMDAFAKAIGQQLGKPDEWRAELARLTGASAIDTVAELLKDLRIGEQTRATVLLPIDQFEEMFIVATAEQRDAFLRLMAAVLDPVRDLPLMVLATGRSDVLDGLIEAGELARLYETEPLPPLPLDRVVRLVEGPAAVAGLNVERGLAERMGQDTESVDALPLLAYTLWLLHHRSLSERRLGLEAYEALSDRTRGLNPIQNSVRLAADQAIEGLLPKPTGRELNALRDAFVPHLVRVRLGEGKRVRQPAYLQDLPEESRRLVRALIEARLLVTRDGLIEVAHEALFKAWPTLNGWLTEEHMFLSDLERIRSAREAWAQAGPEQRAGELLHGLLLSRARDWLLRYPQRFVSQEMEAMRAFVEESAKVEDAERAHAQRRRQRVFQAVVVAAAIFASAAGVAGWQYVEADKARRAAVAERERAERNFAAAKQAANDVVFRVATGMRMPGMNVGTLVKVLEAAGGLMDRLAQVAPDDKILQRSRAMMLIQFAETYLQAGDNSKAVAASEESLKLLRDLAAVYPSGLGPQRDVTLSLMTIGDVRREIGDRAGALAAYQESLTIARKLAAIDSRSARAQRDISQSLEKIGDGLRATSGRPGALAAYEESAAIMRNLAAGDPGNTEWRRELGVNLNRVGDERRQAGDAAGALSAYEESLDIMRKLSAADPANIGWQRDVLVGFNRIGDVRRATGDRSGALSAYEEMLAIGRKIVAAAPTVPQWQDDVSLALERIGEVRHAEGDWKSALAAHEESLAIRRRLSTTQPNNDQWQRLMGVSFEKIGDQKLAIGDPPGALAAYEESLTIRRKLAAANPNIVRRQSEINVSLTKIGEARFATGDRASALIAYEEGLAIARKLVAAEPNGWGLYLLISLRNVAIASDVPRARVALNEAVAVSEMLEREGKLAAEYRSWSKDLRERLDKLPPDPALQ
jgi:tetratricopeptide (TPR) repeat protein